MIAQVTKLGRFAQAIEALGVLVQKQGKDLPLLAFNSNLRYNRAVFLEPDGKHVRVMDIRREDISQPLRGRHMWEALDVTMKRRASEAYGNMWKHNTFKVLGLGLHDGTLVFVYSAQAEILRLPVREEDLPDLPAAQTAE